MNVGLLASAYAWGGTEIHAVRLARVLAERGHTATLVCLTDSTYQMYREHTQQQITLIRLPIPKSSAEEMGFLDWWRLFARQPWDVCLLIKGDWSTGGGCAVDLAARYRFGNYLTIEQLNAKPLPPKTSKRHLGFIPGLGLWWYRRYVLPRFLRSLGPRKVVCVSDRGRHGLIEECQFPPHKVVTVRNGIDPERFRPDPAHRETWRRRWGIPDGALVFGALGRFDVIKGYDTALAGFQTLLQRYPERDLRLVLVGEGPHEAALKAHADRIVPGERVVFAPFCDRPWEALNALDIFVMPSLNEGLPFTLLEAMACGCCPVASTAGGIPEVLSSPDLGWLAPVGDSDAFAAAMIEAAARTPEERAAIGQRGRRHVQALFNATVQFNALVDILESYGVAPTLRRVQHVPEPVQS